MLCDLCHKNIATVHLTEIVKEKVEELHICQACAKHKAEELKDQFHTFGPAGLSLSPEEHKRDEALRCPSCALTYADFKQKGRLGCGQCYTAFRKQLKPLLKKVHNAVQHVGKSLTPQNDDKTEAIIAEEYRNRLNRAIKLEAYEEAAWLRDQLKKLEQSEGRHNV